MLSKVIQSTKSLNKVNIFTKVNVTGQLQFNQQKLGKKGGEHNNLFNYGELESDIMKTSPFTIGQPTVRPTKLREQFSDQECNSVRAIPKINSWDKDLELMTEEEAIREAQRCLKCTDAPCQSGCSTSIDIKTFIYQIEHKNWYGAAKTILSDNPVGMSCGLLCPVSKLCAGPCNMFFSEEGPIKINHLQDKALKTFMKMGVKQIRDPSLPTDLPPSYDQPIALIGCGSATIGCATFLARLGYRNVHVYERDNIGGGIIQSEIPKNRASLQGLEWEIQLMKDLGVKVFYNKSLGEDFTVESLKNEGYKAIFLGSGLPQPKKMIGDIYDIKEVYNSKTFLPPICKVTKQIESDYIAPQLDGHVVVIGIGDTALDCARSAYRMGAKRVSVVFRRGFNDLRANDEIFLPAFYDGCNFIPYSNPEQVLVDPETNKVTGVKFQQNLPNEALKYQTGEQSQVLKCDHLVTAFGAELTESWSAEFIDPKTGMINFNPTTMQSKSHEYIFAGGDICGTANLVDAVNDGKTASWFIHKYLQELQGEKVSDIPKLPGFFTEIDKVDISTEIAGVKIPNPFGLASAPPTTSYPMIKKAFDVGWGFAVTKTYCLDKDTITNISPRIYKGTSNPTKNEASFANIELISEKSAKYWIEGCKETKKEYPDHVIVGSYMCQNNKQDWQELTLMSNEAPFDIYELNLSCPHGMGEYGMGRACGEDVNMVRQITEWVCEVATKPVFVKITPNWAYADELSIAAQEGGAAGVTLTNTMPSLMDPNPSGNPWPRVGPKEQFTYGGACGSVLRPFALKKCAETAANPQYTKDIFGSGGIVGPDHALSFIRYGAKALQIASAVMNQDAATCAFNLETGLKAHMYLTQREDLVKQGWVGQQAPYNFYDLPTDRNIQVNNVPSILDLVNTGLGHISDMTDLERDILKPVINDDVCLKCGRCYLTCADNGYQAFKFDDHTQVPELIESKCTGCALCVAVCPVQGAIDMEPMSDVVHVHRGIEPNPTLKPQHAIDVIQPRHIRHLEL